MRQVPVFHPASLYPTRLGFPSAHGLLDQLHPTLGDSSVIRESV